MRQREKIVSGGRGRGGRGKRGERETSGEEAVESSGKRADIFAPRSTGRTDGRTVGRTDGRTLR